MIGTLVCLALLGADVTFTLESNPNARQYQVRADFAPGLVLSGYMIDLEGAETEAWLDVPIEAPAVIGSGSYPGDGLTFRAVVGQLRSHGLDVSTTILTDTRIVADDWKWTPLVPEPSGWVSALWGLAGIVLAYGVRWLWVKRRAIAEQIEESESVAGNVYSRWLFPAMDRLIDMAFFCLAFAMAMIVYSVLVIVGIFLGSGIRLATWAGHSIGLRKNSVPLFTPSDRAPEKFRNPIALLLYARRVT